MGGVGDIMTVMLVLAGAYILLKSGKLEEILGGDFKLPELPGLPAPTAPAPEAESEEGEPAAPAGPSGPAPTGTSCPGGQSCASSNGGTRNECDGVSSSSYEATWCGQFSGDDLSVKVWGPNHSGSSCCWCILSVSPDGAFGIRHEGPHPDTSDKTGTTAAIGKPSCIKAVVRPGPGGINLEGWGLVGGQWKKAFSYAGQCGHTKKSSTPSSSQQVAFRCDGSLQTSCATVSPIGGGGGGGAPAAEGPREIGGGGGDAPAAGKRTIGAGAVRVTGCGPKCIPTFDKRIAARNRYDIYDSILARL